MKDTADVLGSVSQCQAPMAVQIEMVPNRTVKLYQDVHIVNVIHNLRRQD